MEQYIILIDYLEKCTNQTFVTTYGNGMQRLFKIILDIPNQRIMIVENDKIRFVPFYQIENISKQQSVGSLHYMKQKLFGYKKMKSIKLTNKRKQIIDYIINGDK